jgi:hypothetical protein
MKKYIAVLIILALWLAFSSCGTEELPTKCNLGETIAFGNGVQFTVTEAKFATEIKGIYSTYRADEGNKYLLLKITVANNAKESYHADGTDIWLNYNGARIAQIKLVERWENGFDDVSQAPTTVVTYNAFFQVGNQIELSDLALVISNGKSLLEERLTIMLTP